MTLEANKAVVRQLYEAIVGGRRIELIDTLIAKDAVDHNAAAQGWGSGPDGFRAHAAFFHGAFGELAVRVDDLVAEGERVIAFWSFTGVHVGEVWGVAASGQRVEGHTVSILRLRDGKVVEYESRPDRLGLLAQFGALGRYAEPFAWPA